MMMRSMHARMAVRVLLFSTMRMLMGMHVIMAVAVGLGASMSMAVPMRMFVSMDPLHAAPPLLVNLDRFNLAGLRGRRNGRRLLEEVRCERRHSGVTLGADG
jgi:hypothetical protein